MNVNTIEIVSILIFMLYIILNTNRDENDEMVMIDDEHQLTKEYHTVTVQSFFTHIQVDYPSHKNLL